MKKSYNGNESVPVNKEPVIDFNAIFHRYKRYWWLFAVSLLACLALAVLYLRAKLPEYHVHAAILVEQDDNAAGAGASLLKSLSIGGIGGSKVDDEVLVINSNDLRCKTITQLKINRTYVEKTGFLKKEDHYKESPIFIDAPDELFDTLSVSMKFNISVDKKENVSVKVKKGRFKTLAEVNNETFPVQVKTPYGTFTVNKTQYFKDGKELEMTSMVMGTLLRSEKLNEDLSCAIASKKANAINLDIIETNVDRAKDILNTIIKLYNERGEKEKNEMATNTAGFINERLAIIYQDLTASEADIENYKRSNNMVDAELQAKSEISKQAYSEQAIINLETQYRIVGMIKEFVENPRNAHSLIPFEADSMGTSSSVKAYNRLILERMELERSATGDNQALKLLDDQITTMRGNITKNVNATLAALKLQIDKANAINARSTGKMSEMPMQERAIRSLYREQGIQNSLYTFLLQKREENQLLLAATTPKGKIIDEAYADSEQVAPKTFLVLLMALAFGLLIPILILYLKQLFTTKFSSQEELESIVDAPIIGEICHNRHSSELVVKPDKTSSIVELFRLARNNVQFMLPSEHDKVLLVTSSVSGEGKSFVSMNLAASFALLGKRVALVGLDIRSPKLAEMLGKKDTPGITSYLSQQKMSLNDICQSVDEVDGLDVYVGGVVPPNPSELLLGDRVKELFTELREKYDLIIVDSAPIAMVSDTFSLAPHSNVIVYVTRANYTKRSLIKYLNQVIQRGQLKNIAVILNDSNPKLSQGYGYGYGSKD